MSERRDLRQARLIFLHRNRARQQIFVEIEQLDFKVAIGVRLAEQDVLGLALVVGKSEGGIFEQFDIAADQSRLARAALTLLAPMHQCDALAKGRIEHGLAFFDLHLEADRLKAHRMNHHVGHKFSIESKTSATSLDISHGLVPLVAGLKVESGGRTRGPLIDSWASGRD